MTIVVRCTVNLAHFDDWRSNYILYLSFFSGRLAADLGGLLHPAAAHTRQKVVFQYCTSFWRVFIKGGGLKFLTKTVIVW